MKSKWYVEFLLVLALISVAVIFALNINFSSPAPVANVPKTEPAAPSKTSIEKEKWIAGHDMFKANCAACHNVKFDGVGPPLKGALGRWKNAGPYKGKSGEQWMKMWVRNWHDVVDAGYKYGIDLKNSRPAQMNIFVSMTDEKIDEIMFYVESPDFGKTANP